MAYIGRGTDKLSNIEKLDTITFDGSSSYTLQKNSVNFTPSSANSLQVSIDGVVQAGNFTVSGSTIDFGVAIPSTSTNDFIFHYGTGLITTPADGTVTTGKIQDGAVTSAKLASGVGGKVLQVVQAVKTDTFTQGSANVWSDITGLSVSITPSSSSNKILVMGKCAYSADSGYYPMIKLVRDSTDIFVGDADGSRVRVTSASYSHSTNAAGTYYGMSDFAYNYLDSPATTSSTTYKIQLRSGDNVSSYINRTAQNDDNQFRSRGASSIIVMEISA